MVSVPTAKKSINSQAPDEPEARVLRALADEIGISAQQLGSLSRHRAAIRAQRAALQRCHALLTRVRAQVVEPSGWVRVGLGLGLG